MVSRVRRRRVRREVPRGLAEEVEELADVRVSELTPEEVRVLREWEELTRSRRAISMDLRRYARIPAYVGTWLRHPGRYDIPGVDTPPAKGEEAPPAGEIGKKEVSREGKSEGKEGIRGLVREVDNVLVNYIKEHGVDSVLIEDKVFDDGAEVKYSSRGGTVRVTVNVVPLGDGDSFSLVFFAKDLNSGASSNFALTFKGVGKLRKALKGRLGSILRNAVSALLMASLLNELKEEDKNRYEEYVKELTGESVEEGEGRSRYWEGEEWQELASSLGLLDKLDVYREYLGDVLTYIAKGVEKLVNGEVSLSDLEGIIADVNELNKLGKAGVEEARSKAEEVLKTAEEVRKGSKKLDDLIFLVSEFLGNDMLPYLYLLGKYGRVDKSLINSLSRKYVSSIKELCKELGVGEDVYGTVVRLLRSSKLSRKLGEVADVDMLLTSDLGRKVVDDVRRLGLHNTLIGILLWLYDTSTEYGRGWRERKVEIPMEFSRVMSELIDRYLMVHPFVRAAEKGDVEDFKELLRNALGTKELRIGPLEFKVSKSEGKFNVEAWFNGSKVGEVKGIDLKDFISRSINMYGSAINAFKYNVVDNLLGQLREKLNVYSESLPSGETVFYRIRDEGIEVLYPEHRLYRWREGREFLPKYSGRSLILTSVFREEARKHGVEYPEFPEDAYEFIFTSKSPKVLVVKGKEYYVLANDKWGNLSVVLSAPSEEKLIESIKEGIEKGVIQSKLVKPLLSYLEMKGYALSASSRRRAEVLSSIGSAIGFELEYNKDYGIFIDPAKVMAVSFSNSNALEENLRKNSRIAEIVGGRVKEVIAAKVDGKVVPINSLSIKRIRKEGGRLVVRYDGREFIYPKDALLVVKKMGIPEKIELFIPKEGEYPPPIKMVYNGFSVYTAPIVE